MKKTLLAIVASAALVLPMSAPALAYPAGQAPVIAFSTVGRIVPGDNVSVQISRVKKNCVVSVAWAETDSVDPVSKTIKATGKSGVITIATPDSAGTYTLTSSISGTCAGGDPVVLSKSVVVGKLASIVGKITTSSAFVSKNPTLTVSGTIKSGSLAVANKSIIIRLKKGGEVVKTQNSTTNGSGAFSVSLTGTSYTAGSYTAEVELPSGSIYGQTVKTTAALNLR